MESRGTSSGDCEANASVAQEECPPSSRSLATREPEEALTRGRAVLIVAFMRFLARETGEALARGRAVLTVAFMRFLTRELLTHTFLRMALPLLLLLRHYGMDGKRAMDWNDPKPRERCAQRWESNTLCGIVLKEPDSATFNVGVVHSGVPVTLSWHKLLLDRHEPVNTLCSGDGGLVCFCLTFPGDGDDLGLVLMVVNPLTGACRVLPSDHGVSPFDLRMMQLMVDKSTWQYQVLLVHDKKEPSSSAGASQSDGEMSEEVPGSEESDEESGSEESEESSVEIHLWFPEPLGGVIFDSGTGMWRNARSSSQVFLGPAIHEERYVRGLRPGWSRARNDSTADICMMDYQGSSRFFGPVAYNCATEKVITLCDPFDTIAPHAFALSKDRLFDMKQYLSEYLIRVRKDYLGIQTLVDADHLTREAHAKMRWPVSPLKVLACEGYLLVRESPSEEIFHRRTSYRVVGQLYDMRAGKWVDLRERRQDLEVARIDELMEVLGELDVTDEVRAYGGYPRYFESAPIMLCNLDWEAVP